MPWDAVLSNGKRYTFPDDVDEKQAQRILVSENRGLFPDAQGGFLDAGMSSGKRLLSNINAAGDLTLGAILDDEERFQRGIRSLERGEEWAAGSLPAPVTLDEISKTYEDEGLGSAVGRTGQWALETMGQSLPYMVPMLGAGKLAAGPGARALAQTMPQVTKRLGQNLTSTLAGHTAGATSMIPAFYADNLARQVEEGAITEDQLEPMLAALAAPAQSALEYIFVALMGNIGRAPQKAAALSISQFLKRQALEASTEIPTEMAQTVIERAQAGASISPTDREAVEEVLYAGLAGGVAGAGFGTVSTATQIPGVLRQRKMLEQEEALRKEADEAIEKNVQEEKEAILTGGGDLVRARQLGLESLDPVNAQIEQQTIAELVGRPVTPKDIHAAARSRNILYDDDIGFLAFTKKVTGFSHIDDVKNDQEKMRDLYNAVTSFTRQPIEDGTAGVSLPTWTETEYQTAVNYHRARKKRKARKGKAAVRARGQIPIDDNGDTIREALNLSLSDEDVQLAIDIRDEAIRRGAAKKKKGQIVLSKKPWYSEAEYREVLNRSRARVDAKTGKPAPMVTRGIVEEVTDRKSLIAINGMKKDMVERGDASRVSTQTVPITMNSVLRNRDLFLDEDKGFLIRTSPDEGGEILGGRTTIRAARKERKRLEARDTRYFLVAEDGLIVGNEEGYKPSRQKHGKKKDPKATARSAKNRLIKQGVNVIDIAEERPTYYESNERESGFRIGERRADLYGHTAPFEVEFLGDEDTAKKRMRTLTGEFAGGFPVEQRIADTVEGEVDARLPQRIDTRTQEYSKEEIARREALLSSLTRSLGGFGLNDIRLRLTEVFRGEGGVDEATGETKPILRPDTEGEYNAARIITLALNNLTSDMSPEQQAAALVDVMNHEIIHAMRSLDLFTNSEWVVLRKYVETRPYPGDANGRTYYEVAMDTYADGLDSGNMGIDDIFEEAVAQAFRFYVKDPKGVVGTPRSLFERIMSFLEKIGNFLVSNDLTTSEDIFEEIRTGRIGGRARGEIRTIKDVLTPKGQAWAKVHHVIGPGDKPKESRVVPAQYKKLGGSFRSALGTSLREVPEGQEKKNLEQWRKYLQNTGVTMEEMQWSGLDDYMESIPEDRKSIHVNDIKNNVLELGISEYRVARPRYQDVLRFQGDDYTELVITLPESHELTGFRQWYDDSVIEVDDTPGAERIFIPDELLWDELTENQRKEAIRRYRLETGDVAEIADIMSDSPRRRTFTSSHYGDDVLAWIRYTIDTDSDGNRILLIQEIQSDWHQKGRAEGYGGAPIKNEVDPETIQLKESEWVEPTELEMRAASLEDFMQATDQEILNEGIAPWTQERVSAATTTYENMKARGSVLWKATRPDGRPINIASIFGTGFVQAPSYEEAMDYAKSEAIAFNEESRNAQAPDAPFKNTWHALGLKRAIAIAASKGIDRVAWTTGRQQKEVQQELITQNVDRLEWESTQEGIISVTSISPDGTENSMDFYNVRNQQDYLMSVDRHQATNQVEHLRDVFGVVATLRITDNPESGSMPGSEMVEESEFLNILYDKKLVKVANDIGRKYGSEVESIELGMPEWGPPFTSREGQPVHSFVIPDELKRNILAQGFNLFGKKESRRIHADRQLGIFRSRLKDALYKAEEKNLPPMTPTKIIEYLGKNGVTQDEILWSGLEEYLKDPPGTLMVNSGKHKGKIVLSLLWGELNPVQIEEQFFTGKKIDDDDLMQMRDRYRENEFDRYGVVEVAEEDVNQDEDSDEYGEDRHGRTVGFYAEEDAGDALMGPYDDASEAEEAISEHIDNEMDYVDDDDVISAYGPEGADLHYGATNAESTMTGEWEDSYEELLLRLPRRVFGSRRPLGPAIPEMLGHYSQDHGIDDGLVWGRYTQKHLDHTELPSFVSTYDEAVSKLKEMGYTFVLGGVTGERGSWGITSPDELIDLVNSGTARSMAGRNHDRVFFIEEIQSDIEARVSSAMAEMGLRTPEDERAMEALKEIFVDLVLQRRLMKKNFPLTKSAAMSFISTTRERLPAFKNREYLEPLLNEYSDKEFSVPVHMRDLLESTVEDYSLTETSDHIRIRMLLNDLMRAPEQRSRKADSGFLSNEELSDAGILERMDTNIARAADALGLDESEIELYRESILRDIDIDQNVKEIDIAYRNVAIGKERILIERIEDSLDAYDREMQRKPEDIPFKDAVYMIMFKRLVAEAASRGFKHIAWTTSESQVARWNDRYEKFYKELYDNKLVAYAKRLGGRFGAKVKKRVMPLRGVTDPQARDQYTVTEGHVDVIHISDTQNTYGGTVETPLFGEIDVRASDIYEVQGYVTSGGEERTLYEKPVRVNGLEAAGSANRRIQEYIDGLVEENDTLVWSMEIPEKMVDSIENQGYGLFGTKESKIVIPSGMRSTFNYPEKGSVRIPTALEDALVPQNKFTPIGTVPRINVNASDRAQQIARGEIEGEKMSSNDWIPFYLDTNKASFLNPEYSQRASEVIKIPTKTTFWELVQDVLEFKDWGGLAGLMTLMRQKFVDKYARIAEIERLVIEKMRDEGKEEKEIIRRIMADQSAAAAAYRSDRGAGILQASLNRGIPVFLNGRTTVEDLEIAVMNANGAIVKGKGGFTQIIKPLLRNHINKNLLESWGFYRLNLRENRFAAEGRETQLDPVEIRKFLNDFNEALGDKGHKDHQAARIIQMVNENFDKWNGGFVDYMVSTGVLLPEMGQAWKETADYIPFFRQWQEEATEEQSTLIETVMEKVRIQNPKVPRTMIGSLTGIKLPKRAKGGKKPVLDPITTILQNSLAAITSGLKNEAAGKVMADAQYVGMAERLGVVGDYDQAGVDPGYIHTIREEGVEVDYLVKDPLLHNSLEGFTEGKLPYLSMVAAPSTFLREMITRSPDFIIANLLRDTVSAWATSGSEFTPFSDTLKNMVESRETPSYEALSRAGLNMGYDFGRDMKSARDEVMKQFRKEGLIEDDRFSIQKTIMNIWDWAGDVTTKSDMATRQAVYQDVLKRLTPVYGAEVAEVEAEFQAQEIINFSRRGNSTLARYLTAAVPFLNARVQGLDVLYRAGTGRYSAYSENTLSNESMKIFFSRMMFLSSAALIYWMFVHDDEEYRNARPEVRQDNIILPGFGGLLGTVIPNKIPKPFEVGLIAWTIPEMFAELISGNQDMRQTVQGMTRGLQTTLSINPVPQAVRPLFEAYNNKSWFTGRSIVPYFQTGLSPELQAGMNTSALAQEMGSLFNISPLKVDHILKGYTGTVGSYILFASDVAVRPMLGYEAAPSLLGEPERWPMFRRFFQGKDGGGRLAEYYDFREASERITNDILDLRGKGRHEEATKLTKDNLGIIRTQSVRQGLDNTLANLRRQRNRIYFSPTMSAGEKQHALNEIKKIETKILAGIPEIRERADLPVELPFPLSIFERR